MIKKKKKEVPYSAICIALLAHASAKTLKHPSGLPYRLAKIQQTQIQQKMDLIVRRVLLVLAEGPKLWEDSWMGGRKGGN